VSVSSFPRLPDFSGGLRSGEAVRGVVEAIKDGIGDGRIDDHLVPVIDGELTGHNRGAAAVAIVNDFEQVAALLRGLVKAVKPGPWDLGGSGYAFVGGPLADPDNLAAQPAAAKRRPCASAWPASDHPSPTRPASRNRLRALDTVQSWISTLRPGSRTTHPDPQRG
jgi:hypothetical protein